MARKKTIQEEVFQLLGNVGGHGISISSLESQVSCERHTLSKYLHIMQQAGIIDFRLCGRSKLWFLKKAPLQHMLKSRTTIGEQVFSGIVDAIPFGILLIDKDYNIIFQNAATGREYGNCCNKTFYEAVLGKENPLSINNITTMIDSKARLAIQEIEDRFSRKIFIEATRIGREGSVCLVLREKS